VTAANNAPHVSSVSPNPVYDSTHLRITINVGTTGDTWTVKAQNPGGSYSSPYSFSVTASAPHVSSVSPNPVTGSASAQTFTIYGTGFTSNSTVTLGNQFNTYPNRPISSRNATQIVITPTFGTTAATWWVQVIDGSQQSNQYQFSVK